MRTGGIFLKKKTKTLLTCLAVPLGVGAVSGFLTQGSMNTFEKLKQPPLTPPGWVFPVVIFLWPVFFFNAGWYLFAFAWLLFLWYLVYLCTKTFSEISRTAGYLMIPYLVWLTFAGYLNFFIFLLN